MSVVLFDVSFFSAAFGDDTTEVLSSSPSSPLVALLLSFFSTTTAAASWLSPEVAFLFFAVFSFSLRSGGAFVS